METPVVFLIFNRPDVTARSFEAIRQARPRQFLIVADGPRPSRPGEEELCARARKIAETVDWPCEVLRNYAETNMGCGKRMSSGITWAFDRVEDAIFLEDDCIPDSSFFPFCAELLERYRDDERIMMISGDNFQYGRKRGGASYYFTRFTHLWGWAGWRRAWRLCDFSMAHWPELRSTRWLKAFTRDPLMEIYWRDRFDSVAEERLDTWDYQWVFSMWANNGLSIAPSVNLVTNIGFGPNAAHNTQVNKRLMIPAGRMEFPLKHPAHVFPYAEADEYEERHVFLRSRARAKLFLRRLLDGGLH